MSKQPRKVRFIPGDMNYRWNDDSESPFLKRSVINFSYDAKTKAQVVRLQNEYYDLLFQNEKEPFLSRNQPSLNTKDNRLTKEPSFLKESDLIANSRQIRFTMSKLIQRLITTLENNPQSLFEEAENIKTLCRAVGYSIRPIETFNRLNSWEEFMEILKSLEKKEYKFKFELLIAAVTQYAALCS